MKQIIPLTLRSDPPRSNFRALTSALCSFAILIMPFAQMAAAARGNQRSELSDQRSKFRDARNAAAEKLLQPNGGSPIIGATLTDNRPSTDPAFANPGDTIHYTAIISNTGTADATGVQFNDDVDANTTVDTSSVKMSPVVSTQPSNQTVCAGGTATFTAAAAGTPTPTVQWQVDSGSGFTNIPGATSTTLSFSTVAGDNGKQYRAVFTNSLGSANTNAATLTVDTLPVVMTDPVNQTVCAGGTATFTAAATSNASDHTVQWQVSSGGPFTDIPGATSTTLSFSTVAGDNGKQYRAVFTDACGSSNTTGATLTVDTLPVVTTDPQSQSVSDGGTATFNAAATSNASDHTVQWQVSTGGPFTDITGATSTTLSFTVSASDNGKQYRAVFTNACGTATTAAATLTVTPAPPDELLATSETSKTASALVKEQSDAHLRSLPEHLSTMTTGGASGIKALNHGRILKLENRHTEVATTEVAAAVPLPCTTTSTHVCVDAGTLPNGKSVTITFSVTVNNPYGGGATVSNQGTVSGSNFLDVSTDDPDTGAANDATVTPVCSATTLVTNTNDSGNGSLRQAILNLCAGGTINFDTSGVFATSQTITLTSAELSLDRNLTINGPTGSSLTISGNNARRVLNIQSGKTVLISNLTIANGQASTGGGILNAGTLTITNSTLSNNKTTDGADVNSASAAGNSDNGGAIYNTGTLTLINSTLSGNQTGRGGNNSGAGNGGNSGSGGGVYNTGTLKLTNSTVANNKTGSPGQPTPNPPDPENPTGTIGTVGLGGGIFNSGGTLTLNNTIVATNTDGSLNPDDINGTATSSTFNLIGSDAGLNGISNGSNGNQVGTAAVPLSPHLGSLADNGGPTQTHLPDQFSTALDAGSNAQALDQNSVALATDQRGSGFPRKVDGGKGKPDEPTVDIGAVEVTVSAAPPGAELTVAKSVDRDTVVPDRDLTYTIVITNSGADAAVGATMDDTLPIISKFNSGHNPQSFTEDTQFMSLVKPAGTDWSCSTPAVGSGGSIHCTKPTGFNGTSMQTFTLVVHVPSDATTDLDSPFITNSVTVGAGNDTNTENNNGFASTQLLSCITDPVVTKSTDSGSGTLRQAIADACVGSTITFDTTPGHVVSPITLTSGELAINKNLTITGPGANLLTVSGNNASRVFNIQSGTVTISNLTIANGKLTANGVNGAGVLNGGALTLTSCNVYGNNTSGINGFGGGIYSSGSSLTLNNCNIGGTAAGQPNNGVWGGGGIFINSGTVNVNGGTVSGNVAGTSNGGAGIQISGGTVSISGATVSQNQISISGGGGISVTGGSLSVINSLFSGNSASSGGALYNSGGAITLVNTTVSGNSAIISGGGVRNEGGTVTLTNVTVTNNRSDSDNFGNEPGGGIYRGAGTVTLKNTIVAGNFRGASPSTTRDDVNGAVDMASSSNLIGDGTNMTGISNASGGNQVGSAGSPINAMLGALANNGGSTQTHLPLPSSLAVNAGSNANLPADTFDLDGDSNTAETLPVDQRGAGFNRVINTNVDIGAVETNYAISATAGTPQSATINSAFGTVMKATVTESGNPQNGVSVTFTAPASGASGTFPGPSATAVASTNSSGVATATTFTANGIGGSYNVTASIGTSLPTALFALTNNKASTATAVAASPNPSNSSQSVTFTATVTSASGIPTGTVQFKDGGAGIGSPQTLNGSSVATFATSSLSAGVHAITADYGGDAGFLTSTGTLSGGQQVGSIVRFSTDPYNTTENSGSTTITVQRIGDLSQAVTVDYSTPDDSSAMTVPPCSTANGVASSRCDFEVTSGTLRWAAGDGASKTFTVLINQDNFVEGPEGLTLTLSNLTGGAGFPVPGATTSTATLTIADDVTEPATNPVDDTDTFVRQLYRDFLNRVPDAAGLAFWKDNIDKCNDPARRPAGMSLVQCLEVQRINTAASFFLSIEFQNTGFFVERMYKAGFGDISPPTVPVPVRFTNFLSDTQQISAGVIVGQGSWQTQLENNKTAFALAFVQRAAFLSRYPALTSATALVDSWNTNAGSVLSDSERSALISELSPSPADPNLRASVLKKIAENATLQQREFNRAFVLLQYFGFLRRNPDAAPEPGLNFAGYNFWLNKLNQFNGNYIDAEMVKAFLSSFEYRKRFGP
jgi:uncharacterized repeat protein (TIGR01451 family)